MTVTVFVGLFTTPVLAYLGPGGVTSATGALIALGAGLLLALVGFVWYPLKRLFGARRRQPAVPTVPAERPPESR